jgi:hypothetical protein
MDCIEKETVYLYDMFRTKARFHDMFHDMFVY